MLTQKELKESVVYDPETGIFTRRETGEAIGYPDKEGYITFNVRGGSRKAHRMAWLYVHGVVPEMVDHANGVPHDNRICNLRGASPSQSAMNRGVRSDNTSGYKGAYFVRSTGKYISFVKRGGKRYHLGTFNTAKEAHEAYCNKARELHGEFFNPGQRN